jgi:hypothetical protein
LTRRIGVPRPKRNCPVFHSGIIASIHRKKSGMKARYKK